MMHAFASYWVHDLNPVIVPITDVLAIRWYGVAYLTGFAVAYYLLVKYDRAGISPLTKDLREAFVFYCVAGVYLGGRIGFTLLYAFDDFLEDPLIIFQVWKGGMASHGGFVGVFLAVWVFSLRHKVSLMRLGDVVCSIAPPGLFFGRIANFINGELWGKPTNVSWAVIFPDSPHVPSPFSVYVEELGRYYNPRHPSQLYEALLEGLILFVFIQWRMWGTSKGGQTVPNGRIAGEFLIAYGILRILGEIYREPDVGVSLILGMSRGTFYSIVTAVVGILVIVVAYSRSERGKA